MRKAWVEAVAVIVGLLALPLPAAAAMVTLSGEVTYRERMALPAGASLKVRLIDMTAPGTPTRVEAEAAIGHPGQVPLTFTLNFDDQALTAGSEHALVAEISAGIELWFRNSEPYRLDPLAPATPVLIITNFVGRLAGDVAAPAPVDAPVAPVAPSILDVTWRADSIKGEPTATDIDSTLSIAGDLRAGGRGGCNNYFAQAAVGVETISFNAIAATRMACFPEPANTQETSFFLALEAARFWRRDADHFILLDADGSELVRFSLAAR